MAESTGTRVGRSGALTASQDGSVLLLVPVGLLVILLLGALAVDLSLAFAGERRVADLAASWAEAATAEVSDAAFYAGGGAVELDEAEMRTRVLAELAVLDEPGLRDVSVRVRRLDARTVEVAVSADVPRLFLDAAPGMRSRRVDAVAVAVLVVGD